MSLKVGEILVNADFSENYSFVLQDASQGFHWNKATVTRTNGPETGTRPMQDATFTRGTVLVGPRWARVPATRLRSRVARVTDTGPPLDVRV